MVQPLMVPGTIREKGAGGEKQKRVSERGQGGQTAEEEGQN